MNIAGPSGANDIMMQLMQTLLQGMNKQLEMTKDMLAVGVEVSASAEKMAIAQNIIDVYA